jgi:hypothetical protein
MAGANGTGRTSKKTDARIGLILKHLEAGATRRAAAGGAGITAT